MLLDYPMRHDENVWIRPLLIERVEAIAEVEELEVGELFDHIVRSYLESWSLEDDEIQEDQNEEGEEEE